MIYRGIAAEILVAGSLLAQPQFQTSPKPVQQNGASALPVASTSGGPASVNPPKKTWPTDEQESTQLALPGCAASHSTERAANRDYSTPSSRLVGRWTSPDPGSAAVECHYFGPIDQQSGTGLHVSYSLEVLDEKTGARSQVSPGTGKPPHTVLWNQIVDRYQIVTEDSNGDSVTIAVRSANRPVVTEKHQIACDGLVDSSGDSMRQPQQYLDDKNLGCSENNAAWKGSFTRFLAGASSNVTSQSPSDEPVLGSAPFGFQCGMSSEQVLHLVGKGAVKGSHGDRLVLSTAPRTLPLFDSYSLALSPEKGVLAIEGRSSSNMGLSQTFGKLRDSIANIYGTGITTTTGPSSLSAIWRLTTIRMGNISDILLMTKPTTDAERAAGSPSLLLSYVCDGVDFQPSYPGPATSPVVISSRSVSHEIRYFVDGNGQASLTLQNASGGTQQITVSLPWSYTFTAGEGQFVYLSAQKAQSSGVIETTIYLDDVPVKRAASNSAYGIATVSGRVPGAQ